MALGFVFLGYSGLVLSVSPHEIFPGVSLWDAAAPRSSQLFTIVGAAVILPVILPVILAYTTLGYWVFRGKVRHGELTTIERSKRAFWFVALWLADVGGAMLLALPFKLLIRAGAALH